MRNKHNPCGSLVEAFIGLHTRRGADVRDRPDTLHAFRRVCNGTLQMGTGRYTHTDGTVQEEPCAHVERVALTDLLQFLHEADQESTLYADDWGRWFLLYADGRKERLPGALVATTGQPDGDHCQLGDLFYQVAR